MISELRHLGKREGSKDRKSVLVRGSSICKGPEGTGNQGTKGGQCDWRAVRCGSMVQGELKRPAGIGGQDFVPCFESKSTQQLLRGLRAKAGLYFEKVPVSQVVCTEYYPVCSWHLIRTC